MTGCVSKQEETRDKRRDRILASTGGDDGVHDTRHRWTVIGSQHENHLQEAAGLVRQTAMEPEERGVNVPTGYWWSVRGQYGSQRAWRSKYNVSFFRHIPHESHNYS